MIRAASIWVVLASAGCASTARPVAREMIPYEADAAIVDSTVGRPIAFQLMKDPEIAAVTTVSTPAGVTLYAVGTPGSDGKKLPSRVAGGTDAAKPNLPVGVQPSRCDRLADDTAVPPVPSRLEDGLQVLIDFNKASAAGVTAAEIDKAFAAAPESRPATLADAAALGAVDVIGADGHRVRLGDVASVKIRPTPVVVRQDYSWPK